MRGEKQVFSSSSYYLFSLSLSSCFSCYFNWKQAPIYLTDGTAFYLQPLAGAGRTMALSRIFDSFCNFISCLQVICYLMLATDMSFFLFSLLDDEARIRELEITCTIVEYPLCLSIFQIEVGHWNWKKNTRKMCRRNEISYFVFTCLHCASLWVFFFFSFCQISFQFWCDVYLFKVTR